MEPVQAQHQIEIGLMGVKPLVAELCSVVELCRVALPGLAAAPLQRQAALRPGLGAVLGRVLALQRVVDPAYQHLDEA